MRHFRTLTILIAAALMIGLLSTASGPVAEAADTLALAEASG